MPHADLFPLTAPVLLVLVGALACLGGEPFLRRDAKHLWLPWIAVAFAALAMSLLGIGTALLLPLLLA